MHGKFKPVGEDTMYKKNTLSFEMDGLRFNTNVGNGEKEEDVMVQQWYKKMPEHGNPNPIICPTNQQWHRYKLRFYIGEDVDDATQLFIYNRGGIWSYLEEDIWILDFIALFPYNWN